MQSVYSTAPADWVVYDSGGSYDSTAIWMHNVDAD